jgi:hypothetical protein
MLFWLVTTAAQIRDPREHADETWPGCTVLTFAERQRPDYTSRPPEHTALIHANAADAAELRSLAGILAVEQASDGPYSDPRSRSTVRIWDGGAQIERVPER